MITGKLWHVIENINKAVEILNTVEVDDKNQNMILDVVSDSLGTAVDNLKYICYKDDKKE